MKSSLLSHLALPVLIISTGFAAPTQSWPGFLGAGHTPLAAGDLPLSWSPTENFGWHAALPGFGQSSPIIWGDTVYLTSVDGPMKEKLIVTALALADGGTRWSKTFDNSAPEESGHFISRAAPTPVVGSRGVTAFFEGGDVVSLTHAGEKRWQRSLSRDYGKFDNKYGLGSSPVLDGDRVLVLIDHVGPSYVVGLDEATGRVLWKTDRGTGRGSWTSPLLLSTPRGRQLVCSSAGSIDGYDPATGRQLWSFADVGGNRLCSPTPAGDAAFLIGSQISREFPDTDAVKRSNLLMRLVPDGEGLKPEVVWRTLEASPAMASPVAFGGSAYWINRVGALFCFDVATGATHYTERLKQAPNATPLAVGDRLYIVGKDGITNVIALGPKFEVLAKNHLWANDEPKPDQGPFRKETDTKRKAASSMRAGAEIFGFAVVPHHLVVRTGSHAYCVRATRR